MTVVQHGRKVAEPNGAGYQVRGEIRARLCPVHRARAEQGEPPVRIPRDTGRSKPGPDQVTIDDLDGGARRARGPMEAGGALATHGARVS